MDDLKKEFCDYLDMGKQLSIIIKEFIDSEYYIQAAFKCGQLHTAFDFKLDMLEGECKEECENQENSKDKQ